MRRTIWIGPAITLAASCMAASSEIPTEIGDGDLHRPVEVQVGASEGVASEFDTAATNLVGASAGNADSSSVGGITPTAADASPIMPASHGPFVWIAFGPGATSCMNQVRDLFACVLGASDFGDLAMTYKNMGGSHAYRVSFGGVATLSETCGALWSPDYQCVVNAAHFHVSENDVVLVVRREELGGINTGSSLIPIQAGGHTVHIRGADVGNGSGTDCRYTERIAVHEAFEITSETSSADCCTGETRSYLCPQCPVSANACRRFGPASLGGDGSYGISPIQCGSQIFYSQRVTPGSDEFNPNACQPMKVVDPSSPCVHPHDVRTKPYCYKGNLYTCEFSLTPASDCHGQGCSNAPNPHCNNPPSSSPPSQNPPSTSLPSNPPQNPNKDPSNPSSNATPPPCAQSPELRATPQCYQGNLVSCPSPPALNTIASCGDAGCTDTPTPHCNLTPL